MPITTESFAPSGFWADDVTGAIALACVTGAPFARALTPRPTSKPHVSFPRANPTGFDWVGEGQPIPAVDMDDDADVIAVAKLAGLLTLSNESVDDPDEPIGELLSAAVADAMGPSLDIGLLFGSGGVEPEGCFDLAPEATGGADYRADVIGAWGELVDAGANPTSIVAFSSARVVAWELSRTTDDGVPIHADGAAAMVGPGIQMIAVPSLSAGQTLVADVSRLFLVVRNDFEAKFSDQAAFANDQVLCRIKGRFAVACPNPGKTLRKITAAS